MAYVPKTLTRSYYSYLSDDVVSYELATTTENGTTVNSGDPIAAGTLPAYPRGWVARHIYGVFNDSGVLRRTKVPILDPTNDLWVGTSNTFTKDGIDYDVEGRIGEKRTYKGG